MGWRSQRPELRSAAAELLFELLDARWREPVLAVLDPKALGAGEFETALVAPGPETAELFMSALLGHSSELIRILAASLAAELAGSRLSRPAVSLRGMEPDGRELVSSAIAKLEKSENHLHG